MKKIPLVAIGVMRDGKSVIPEIGKAFDFTAVELADLEKLTETTKVDYVRDPVNEDVPAADTTDEQTRAIVAALLADESNLNANKALKMDVLTAALTEAGLPKITAGERDAIVAEITEI